MSDDRLTINFATLCLVREILIEERGADVTMDDAAAAVRAVLPILTGEESRQPEEAQQ